MNSTYWEQEGTTKTFTHELSYEWLDEIEPEADILDLGCGYGRVTRQLHDRGFTNVVGYDPSRAMIAKAIAENPGPQYTCWKEFASKKKYDLIICLALFTSCPEPSRQNDLKLFIERQSGDPAYLYISDYLLSQNPHYSNRYSQNRLGIHGCFSSDDAVIFRHHEDDHFSRMFSGWTSSKQQHIIGTTLNGNSIIMTQFLFTKGRTKK